MWLGGKTVVGQLHRPQVFWVNANSRLLSCGRLKWVIPMESSFLLVKDTVSSGELSDRRQNSWTTWELLHPSPALDKWKRLIKVVSSETSKQIEGKVGDPTPYKGMLLTVCQSRGCCSVCSQRNDRKDKRSSEICEQQYESLGRNPLLVSFETRWRNQCPEPGRAAYLERRMSPQQWFSPLAAH